MAQVTSCGVLAHEHEAQAQHDFALAVGRDGAAADFVADLHVGHVANANGHALLGVTTISWIWSMVVVRPTPWTSSICVPSRMLPPPTLRLFASTASTTSSNVRPCLISRFGIDADLILLLDSRPNC